METTTKVAKTNQVNLVAQASERMNRDHNSLLDQIKELETRKRRTEALARILQSSLPKKVLNRCSVEFEGWSNYVYAVIKPKFGEHFTEHDTLLITDFCANMDKWNFDKVLNSTSGTFRHELNRRIKYSCNYGIEFRTIENLDGCEVVEETEMQEVKRFKVKC